MSEEQKQVKIISSSNNIIDIEWLKRKFLNFETDKDRKIREQKELKTSRTIKINKLYDIK